MDSRAIESLEDLHARRLEWLEAMLRCGNAIAAPAAVNYCSNHDLVAPSWLVAAAAIQFAALLRRDAPKKRGRSVGLVDRYRQDMTDYARWDQVKTVREKQIEILKEVNFLKANPKRAPLGRLEDRVKMLEWAGRSLKRAFECASIILADDAAFGGPDAVKSSYLRVEKANRTQSQSLRYHMLDQDFLPSIGIEPPSHRMPRVRKVVQLYDLTL